MPRKIVPLVTDEIYHVYNRGVDKRSVFKCYEDVLRFKQCMELFNTIEPIGSIYAYQFTEEFKQDPLVKVLSYCLLPNHFHLILEQSVDGGISEFMKRLSGGYTSYFNDSYDRSGSLFQGTFKRVHVTSDEQLRYLTDYVHFNFLVHGISEQRVYSSLQSYTGEKTEKFIVPFFKYDKVNLIQSINEGRETALEIYKKRKETKENKEDGLLE